jgi:glutathione synthase
MRLLWIADPWETLDHPRDTTLRLIEEFARHGVPSWICDTRGLRLEGGEPRVRCRRIESIPAGRGPEGWGFGAAEDRAVGFFDAVHYRVDPPVDRHYWEPLQLLRLAEFAGARTRFVNPLAVLALVSDKLGPAHLVGHLPPTLVASSWQDLAAFGMAEGRTVLKPLGDAASRAVHLLEWTTPAGVERARSLIEGISAGFSRPVLLQRYLEEVRTRGEIRLWFAEAALIGCARKRPTAETFCIDMDRGATCEPYRLSETEAALASSIGRALRQGGVSLAAVDIIGNHVTDANITSPGLLPLMEEALGENLARRVCTELLRARGPRLVA